MSVNFSDDTNNEDFDLFGGMNASDIADDPYDVPDDSYEATILEAKFGVSKNTSKKGLTVQYQITEASNEQIIGRRVSEWFQVGPYETPEGSEDRKKEVARRQWLKRRLVSLGVPESRMGPGFSPEDLIGTDVILRTKKNGDNVRIANLKLKDSGPNSGFGNF